MASERIPLIETSIFRRITPPVLIESTAPNGSTAQVVTASGVFQNFLDENENHRVYPRKVWEKHLSPGTAFAERLKSRGVLGVLEHPGDGVTNIRSVSHVITEVHIATAEEILEHNASLKPGYGPLREGDILGTYECLPEPTDGGILAALLKANVLFGVSSRGSGSVTECANGIMEVNDDFELDTWDAVYNPSVIRAIPRPLREACDAAAKSNRFTINIRFDEDNLKKVRTFNINESTQEAARQVAMQEFLKERKGAVVEATNVVDNNPPPTPAPKAPEPAPAPVAQPLSESTSKPMSKLNEFKDVRIRATQLLMQETKHLKPVQKARLIESIEGLQIEASALAGADPSLAGVSRKLDEDINSFIRGLNEEEHPGGPPAGGPPAPPASASPAPPAAPSEGAEGDDPEENNEEVHEILMTAADKLETGLPEDEEAQETADHLRDIADVISVDVPEDLDLDVDEFEGMKHESKRALARFVARVKILERNHRDLTNASKTLLERHRTMKREGLGESQMINGKKVTLKEALDAATQLAEKNNSDNLLSGTTILKLTHPQVWEDNKAELSKITKWSLFEKRAIELVNEAKAKKKKEREEKNKGKKPPFGKRHESGSRPPANLNEDVPISVRIARRARNGGSLHG